jgi:hypothetical protein
VDDVSVKLDISVGSNDVFIENTLASGRNEKLVYSYSEIDFSLGPITALDRGSLSSITVGQEPNVQEGMTNFLSRSDLQGTGFPNRWQRDSCVGYPSAGKDRCY